MGKYIFQNSINFALGSKRTEQYSLKCLNVPLPFFFREVVYKRLYISGPISED